jgi:hypothetical protein
MELSAILALEYCKKHKKKIIDEHRRLNSQERQCSGLTNSEWNKVITRQKTTFSKSKKFACTRLWSHNRVPTQDGIESLIIKTK